jgi:arsenate reductase (thioredoxin)
MLCTGNSCRSQNVEVVVNAQVGDEWEASSAGTKPAGYVHLKALAVPSKNGIHRTGRSELVDEFRGVDIDPVMTLCYSAMECNGQTVSL